MIKIKEQLDIAKLLSYINVSLVIYYKFINRSGKSQSIDKITKVSNIQTSDIKV